MNTETNKALNYLIFIIFGFTHFYVNTLLLVDTLHLPASVCSVKNSKYSFVHIMHRLQLTAEIFLYNYKNISIRKYD